MKRLYYMSYQDQYNILVIANKSSNYKTMTFLVAHSAIILIIKYLIEGEVYKSPAHS